MERDQLSREAWAFIAHASTLEQMCQSKLDQMPHGEARAIIDELTGVAKFLRDKAAALPGGGHVAASNDAVWDVTPAPASGWTSVLTKRNGPRVSEPVLQWRGLSITQLCDRIYNEWEQTEDAAKPRAIYVDLIGTGAGVVDRLQEMKLPAFGIYIGESCAVENTSGKAIA